jgi:hypothetical protein
MNIKDLKEQSDQIATIDDKAREITQQISTLQNLLKNLNDQKSSLVWKLQDNIDQIFLNETTSKHLS